jgi:hypothetical protein
VARETGELVILNPHVSHPEPKKNRDAGIVIHLHAVSIFIRMFGIGQLLKEFFMFPLHVLQSLKIIIEKLN